MIERDKQVDDQKKKHQADKERQQPKKDVKAQGEQQQAGMSTDKAAMKDEGYVERIDEKTSKH